MEIYFFARVRFKIFLLKFGYADRLRYFRKNFFRRPQYKQLLSRRNARALFKNKNCCKSRTLRAALRAVALRAILDKQQWKFIFSPARALKFFY